MTFNKMWTVVGNIKKKIFCCLMISLEQDGEKKFDLKTFQSAMVHVPVSLICPFYGVCVC